MGGGVSSGYGVFDTIEAVAVTRSDTKILSDAHASWLELRVALRQLNGPQDAGVITTLVRRARSADPNTQREICDAIGRIGHPSGEPLLLALIRYPDPGRTLAATRALKIIGTQKALPVLNEALNSPGLPKHVLEAIRDVIDAIRRREDVKHVPGAITIASEGGELSLSDSKAAALYHEVETAVAEQTDDAWIPQVNKDPWTQLVPPPRVVPLWAQFRMYVDRLVTVACMTSLILLFGVWLRDINDTEPLGWIWFFWGLGTFAMLVEVFQTRSDLSTLKQGELTLATVAKYEAVKKQKHNGKWYTSHRYQLTYLKPDGQTWRWPVWQDQKWEEVEMGDLVPLFISGSEPVIPTTKWECLEVGEDGGLSYPTDGVVWSVPIFLGCLIGHVAGFGVIFEWWN